MSNEVPGVEAEASQVDLFESAQVVGAPVYLGSGTGLPKKLRKANVAIHVYPVRGNYSLVMRKLFNALVKLGELQLKSMPAGSFEALVEERRVLRFETSVSEVKNLIAWERSNDNVSLYAVFEALAGLVVEWNYTSETGATRWRHQGALLSQWSRSDTGRVAWAWMPDLFEALFGSEHSYTALDLELCRMFRSKYSLAMYENVVRYKNIGATPFRPVEDWRLLFAGPNVMREYREFRRSVLLPAMEEIERAPGSAYQFTMEEKRGAKNKVTALRFHIKRRPQLDLDMDLPATNNPAMFARLSELGLTRQQAIEVLANYDEPVIISKLALMMRREASKNPQPIGNKAAYFLAALEMDYRDSHTEREQAEERHIQSLRLEQVKADADKRWLEHQKNEALRSFNSLPRQKQEEFWGVFLEQATLTVRQTHQKRGAAAPVVADAWWRWLVRQEGMLLSEEATDRAAFLLYEAAQRGG